MTEDEMAKLLMHDLFAKEIEAINRDIIERYINKYEKDISEANREVYLTNVIRKVVNLSNK